jgi:hypothetical protein
MISACSGSAPFGDDSIHEFGEKRVVRLASKALEDRLEIVLRLDLHFDRPALLVLGLHSAQALDPRVGPGLDATEIFGVGPHLLADHGER